MDRSYSAGVPHPIERYLLTTYRLDAERMHRLALFLLAHALVDFHLIAAILADDHGKRGGGKSVTLDKLAAMSDRAAAGTFGQHHGEAKRRGLLTPEVDRIAAELNRGRVAFLHWKRDRYEIPRYEGVDVTTHEGLRRCLDDVLRVMLALPVITAR